MTTLSHLPSDLESESNPDTSSINEYADQIIQKVEKNPNDIDLWNQLFNNLDRFISDNVSQDATSKSSLSDEVKTKIHNTYKSLLTRFPYLEETWKKWSIVEYKLNGIEASIDILRMAVESFPHSVSLWNDYLAALKSTQAADPQQFRFTYKEALGYNAYHFTSHPLWDKAIEFETTLQQNSKELLELYLKVINVPLYQYAQYYSQFSEISKNFDIHELMDNEKLTDYVEKFGKSKIDDLSLIEKHQIIDDYFATVFASTQAKVSSNWEYEQLLLHQEFSTNRKGIEEERSAWVEYIDREILAYKAHQDKNQFEFVRNLFERALIPNCFDEELWLKYIKFIEGSILPDEEKLELEQEIYLRTNAKFIPLNQCTMRKLYAYLLLKRNDTEAAIEYLFDWMKSLSGTSRQYFKSPYLEMTREIMQIWKTLQSQAQFQETLEFCLGNYFDKPKEGKRAKPESNGVSGENASYQLSDALLISFAKFLNDDSISLVVDSCLDIYKRQRDSVKIRTLFNKYHRENSLVKSPSFWKFMFEYEAICENNLSNLKLIYHFIRTESQLSKSTIDMFVDWYYDIASTNIREYLSINKGRSDDSTILKDLELSNSVYYNKSTGKRLAKHNYKVIDNPKYMTDLEQAYLDQSAKQAGHPGVFIDANPEITNSFMSGGKYIDLTRDATPVPPLPTFKGVEKVQTLGKRKSHNSRALRK